MTKKKTPGPEDPTNEPAAAPKQRGKQPWLNRMEPFLGKMHKFAQDSLAATRKDEAADMVALRQAMEFVDAIEAHPSFKPQVY